MLSPTAIESMLMPRRAKTPDVGGGVDEAERGGVEGGGLRGGPKGSERGPGRKRAAGRAKPRHRTQSRFPPTSCCTAVSAAYTLHQTILPPPPPSPRRTSDPVDDAGFVSNKDGESVAPHPLRQMAAAKQMGAVVACPVVDEVRRGVVCRRRRRRQRCPRSGGGHGLAIRGSQAR